MRFTTDAGSLREALRVASTATPAAPERAEYGGVLLLAGATTCSVIASKNGVTTVSAQLQITEVEPGRVLLPPRPLATYLATFDPGSAVTIAFEENQATISVAGRKPYKLHTILADLPLPEPSQTPPVKVDFRRLAKAVAAVRLAADKNPSAVQVISSPAGLVLHATDGYRLARAVLPEAGFGTFNGVLPLEVLEWASKLGIDSVLAEQGSRTIRMSGPDVVISTRMLSVQFPPVETLFEKELPNRAVLPVADLQQAIVRLRTVADTAPVKCEVKGSTLLASTTSTTVGSGEEEVALPSTATDTFVFYARLGYLADALASHGTETVELRWTTALEALYISSHDEIEITALLMPVREPSE